MNKLLEFSVPGGVVVVETSAPATESVVRGGSSSVGKLTENIGVSLGDTLAIVRPFADATLAACRELANRPDAVEVQFGLNFNASIGAFIAQSEASASLNIKLVWKPESTDPVSLSKA